MTAPPNTQMQLTGVYVFEGSRSFVCRPESRYVHHHAARKRVAGS